MAFCNRAGNLDGSARLQDSPTQVNQQVTALARAELTGGLRGSHVFNRGKLDFFGILGGVDSGGILQPGGRF